MLVLAALPIIALSASIPIPPRRLDVCFQGPFRTITETTEIGELIGEADRGDWGCLDASSLRIPLPDAQRRGDVRTEPEGVPVPPPTQVCFPPAFPNPASQATRLSLTLPSAASVELIVYGQDFRGGPFRVFPVRTLVSGTLAAGFHQVIWDLSDDQGAGVEPGLYRAVVRVDGRALCGDIEIR